MVILARPIPPAKKGLPTDYELARHIEKLDRIRRDRRNTEVQRSTADELMFLLEGALRDRHGGRWPETLV